MVKISVIVPIYNQENHIERCLDSILEQSLKEIEIILVDDGSTDATVDILSRYQQKDERIRVLHQQNQFAGVARNHGLQAAKGDYVVFWDSDDYFAADALESLYDEIQKEDADICVGESVKIDLHTGIVEEGGFLQWKRIPEKRPFHIEDIPQYIFNFAKNYPWNRLYKRSFLEEKGLQFSELKQSNDVSFVMKAFVLAGKITVTDKIIVYYQYRNEGSLSNNAWEKKENALKAHLEVKDFLIEFGYWERPDIRQSFINNAFATEASQLAMVEDYEEYKGLFAFYKEKALPALGIGAPDIEKMYLQKNAYDLSNILSCDADAYIFKQYDYYRKRNMEYSQKLSKTRKRLTSANEKKQVLKERVENLRLDKEKKTEKIQKQREKIELQSEKLREKNERLQEKNETIQRKNEKIRTQNEKIQKQSEKIQSQQALLDKKLVKAVLKIQGLFS